MVCVAVKGKPIIGVIHQPFSESTSWAVVGFGHSPNLNEKVMRDNDVYSYPGLDKTEENSMQSSYYLEFSQMSN